MSRISYEAATNTLRRFYSHTSSDYVSVEEIYTAVDRADKPAVSNRNWLYNTLSNLKPHNLFEKVYGVRNNVRYTQGIRLTPEGRRALKAEANGGSKAVKPNTESEVTFASVRAEVRKLREMYPEFQITFDARLKVEEEDK